MTTRRTHEPDVPEQMDRVFRAAEEAEHKPHEPDALALIRSARASLTAVRLNFAKAEDDLNKAEAAITRYVADNKAAEKKLLGE